MSTSTPNPTPAPAPAPASSPSAPLPLLVSAARNLFLGLLWGGVLLIVLAWWLGIKFSDERSPTFPWIIGIAGGVGLALAIWHAFTLWIQKTSPAQTAVALSAQRRITMMALLAGGALLLVVSVFLGFMPATSSGAGGWTALRANFGEAVGLFLFSLVALGAGWALYYPPRADDTTVDLEPIRGLFPLIRLALFVLGIALIILFAVLAFHYRAGTTYFPEMAGLILFSMLCLALALWLLTVPNPDAFQTRVFVLIFGGVTGLILFLMSLARAIMWRERIITSGSAAFHGEESWQFWLCVYLQLIGLALMFGSLLLARADIRSNAILRRVLFGYNAVLKGLLVVEMLIIANIVVWVTYPYTYDWRQTAGVYALAEASKNLLHQLKEPTHVFVLMSQGISLQSDVHALLDNIQAESDKVDVKYISPDDIRDRAEYEDLAKKFPKILPAGGRRSLSDLESGRGILIVYGPMPKEKDPKQLPPPHAFIPERKIYDTTGGMRGEKPSRTFKGEVEVMKELNFLVTGGEKRKLYFLQGNDEIDIFQSQPLQRLQPVVPMSQLGAANLVERLKKDNYEVEAITFSRDYSEKKKTDKVRYLGGSSKDGKLELPDAKEAYAVVIAGASSPLGADAMAAIERYIDRGGRLMVLFDIVLQQPDPKKPDVTLLQSGLEDLVKKYGITSADEMAISQYVPFRPSDPYEVLTAPPPDSDNLLAKQFSGVPMFFDTARVIRTGAAGRFKAEPIYTSIPWRPQLATLRPATVAVRKTSEFIRPRATFEDLKDGGELKQRIDEALPFVVAVSDDSKPRMVVFGDTEFISNAALRGEGRANNYSLFVSALEWMSEHKGLVGPQPKTTNVVEMPVNKAEQLGRIHGLPFWLMFLGIVGLGGGVWLVRRR